MCVRVSNRGGWGAASLGVGAGSTDVRTHLPRDNCCIIPTSRHAGREEEIFSLTLSQGAPLVWFGLAWLCADGQTNTTTTTVGSRRKKELLCKSSKTDRTKRTNRIESNQINQRPVARTSAQILASRFAPFLHCRQPL